MPFYSDIKISNTVRPTAMGPHYGGIGKEAEEGWGLYGESRRVGEGRRRDGDGISTCSKMQLSDGFLADLCRFLSLALIRSTPMKIIESDIWCRCTLSLFPCQLLRVTYSLLPPLHFPPIHCRASICRLSWLTSRHSYLMSRTSQGQACRHCR